MKKALTMINARMYLPLIGFVIPTAIIGYGFVIPQSCIAGVNELSVGFGTTLFGAVLTYFAGVRAALRSSEGAVCTKPPLRTRIERWINRQAAHPRGLFGRFLDWNWSRETARDNAEALDLLGIASNHHILEVGCGPGLALHEASKRAFEGHVLGLDVSDLMVRAAQRRNREAIRNGRADVRQADIDVEAIGESQFDRILSVHCLYFWRDFDAVLAKLAGALKPNGRLVLAFRPDGPNVPARFRDATYRFYTPAQVIEKLALVGLRGEIEKQTDRAVWIAAGPADSRSGSHA